MSKKDKNEKIDKNTESTSNYTHRWEEKRPPHPPVGCRACGGPYPLCRDSCPLFD